MGFDDQYRSTSDVFGVAPERTLVEHMAKIDRQWPVLDLGAGQGRNALYLARAGLEVHAVDPSSVATDVVRDLAVREDLPVRVFTAAFDDLEPDVDGYAAILAFGLVQILSWSSIDALVRFVRQWLRPSGLVFVTAFTTDDDSEARYAREWSGAGRSSHLGPNGEVRTYLAPGALPSLFPDFEVVHLWEGIGPEHRHGDGPLERHAMVEAVLRRH